MKEDFLHYVWKLKHFRFLQATTTTGVPLEIFSVGEHNQNAGPDFLNARIKIGGQLWAGNVEIHIKSSDWYLHGHEKDRNYDNVILHVVWEDDIEVFRSDNSVIPALELKEAVSETTLKNYRALFRKRTAFINCEKDITSVKPIVVQNWLERLYFERLEDKAQMVMQELKKSRNDWEAVLFTLLMKNFGLHVNGDAFYSIATAVEYKIIRKIRNKPLQLEALLFGLAGWLADPGEEQYKLLLHQEYDYLKHKFKLSETGIIPPGFSRLRPANFPTIRLSQLAVLYVTHQRLFSRLMAAATVADFHAIFNIKTTSYWATHYTFGKEIPKREKKLSPAFIQLIIINTILPLKWCYAQYTGKDSSDDIYRLIRELQPEDNSIIKKYKALHIHITSAMESQALLQLYRRYCSKQQCLRCAIGNSLIGSRGK